MRFANTNPAQLVPRNAGLNDHTPRRVRSPVHAASSLRVEWRCQSSDQSCDAVDTFRRADDLKHRRLSIRRPAGDPASVPTFEFVGSRITMSPSGLLLRSEAIKAPWEVRRGLR